MKKQRLSFRFGLPLLAGLFLISACEKETLQVQRAQETVRFPIELGAYQVTDVYQGETRTYEMTLRRLGGDHPDRFQITHFADLCIDVEAHLTDPGRFGIAAQRFSTEHGEIQIFEGLGVVTPAGLTITFWGRKETEEFKHELEATRTN